jgi:predicted nucleotidyltransferase
MACTRRFSAQEATASMETGRGPRAGGAGTLRGEEVLKPMHDPGEGVTPDGLIRTGAARGAIAAEWAPVLESAVVAVAGRASLYLYGSVATGCAVVPRSDVDLLSVGLPAREAERISTDLSAEFKDKCREVSIAPASWTDLEADSDEGYGLRVFLVTTAYTSPATIRSAVYLRIRRTHARPAASTETSPSTLGGGASPWKTGKTPPGSLHGSLARRCSRWRESCRYGTPPGRRPGESAPSGGTSSNRRRESTYSSSGSTLRHVTMPP